MARWPRLVAPGFPMHVTHRGHNRQATFHDAEDFASYREILHQASRRSACAIHAYVLMSNHVHLLINFPPDVEVSKLVNNLKTVSSRLIRKDFVEQLAQVYSKPVFWSGAYFVASCGGITIEQLKTYVEHQHSPDE